MPLNVCSGARLQCAMGSAPASLTVIPAIVTTTNKPAATIMDHAPMLNVAPFGMCSSPANPQVAAATAAAQGALTPQPCIPVTTAPWVPGGAQTVTYTRIPALLENARLFCMWAGQITITDPGQSKTQS